METKGDVTFSARTVAELLQDERLTIPPYQRPYKWQRHHIRNLFYDIKEIVEGEKNDYQLGSLILHRHEGNLDIVDGQQRLISISLFLHALGRLEDYRGATNLLARPYGALSRQYAKENTQEWQHLIETNGKQKADEICDFLLSKCSLSVISLPEERLGEAFQLFDSQNNRGKSLEPHDLLKAYHLRSIEKSCEKTVEKAVENWEKLVTDEHLPLKDLFDKHLFRLRRWTSGETGLTKSGRRKYLSFTNAFIDDFKGVDLNKNNQTYPYLRLYCLLEESGRDFPQSLVMPIINGNYFFDYVQHAHKQFAKLIKTDTLFTSKSQEGGDEKAPSWLLDLARDSEVAELLKQKASKYERPKNLFYNILALFIDRFGEDALDKEVLEVLATWAYYPRKAKRIMDSTLANYAAGGTFQKKEVQKLFQVLNHSLTPSDFLQKINRDYFENITLKELIKEINT